MTSNQAFTKKLQAAIKAKIQELGADADDDLSEFVMVLSANKKDKSQMKKELHLFLGKNTGCFVDWLFATLERIQKTLIELKKHEKTSKPEVLKKSPKQEDLKKPDRKNTRWENVPEKFEKSEKSSNRLSRHNKPSRQDKSPKRHDRPSRHEKQSKREKSPSPDKPKKPIKRRNSPIPDKSTKPDKRSKREKSPKHHKNIRTPSTTHEVRPVKISDSEDEPSNAVKSLPRKKETIPEKPSKRQKICPPSPSYNGLAIKQEKSISTKTMAVSTHEDFARKAKQETEEISGRSNDSTPAPMSNPWDGRITIDEESSDEDAEAQIDALLDGLDDLIGTLPETSILSGSNLSSHLLQQQSSNPTQSSETPTVINNTNTETTARKLAERCKFWPGCDKKEVCLYHHPTEVCNLFPNCSFGDRCLNIHPLCKFNKKCKKPRCPFTHDLKGVATVVMYPHDVKLAISQQSIVSTTTTSIQPIPTSQSNMATPCKFGGRCAINNCKFIHPPSCHFGLRCQNHNCRYSHQKPNLKKFQWVNNNHS